MSRVIASQRTKDWLQLLRLPNVFTAIADPLAGALAAGAAWGDVPRVLAAAITSSCLYSSGMALNDWNDYRKDLKERPSRPLPSGRIRRWQALAATLVLMMAGAGLASLAGAACGAVAVLLIACIVLYDVLLKDAPIAPAIMGLCRALNLLLGMAVVSDLSAASSSGLRLWACTSLGTYVCGVTVFARREAHGKQGNWPVVGAIIACAGVVMLALIPMIFADRTMFSTGYLWAALLLALVGLKMAQALIRPGPATIQPAVKMAILGIILFDAALVGFTSGMAAAIPIVALALPALWLGRWLYST